MVVVELSPSEVAERLTDLVSVYEMIYRLAPGSETGFAAILTEHSQRQGFRLCAAIDWESVQTAGFG
jgi:hypothetical protein